MIRALCLLLASQVLVTGAFAKNAPKKPVELDLSLIPTFDVYREVCHDKQSSSLELAEHLSFVCNVVVKSEHCKELPKDDLLQCDNLRHQNYTSGWEFVKGCAKGVFDSVKDFLVMAWDLLKWAGANAVSSEARGETKKKFEEGMGVAKLYLHTEFAKAKAQVEPPFQDAKAMAKMGGAISKYIINSISETLSKSYKEFGCLNYQAKIRVICNTISDYVLPPVAFLKLVKYGKMGLEKVGNKLSGLHDSHFLDTPLLPLAGRRKLKVEKDLESGEIVHREKIAKNKKKAWNDPELVELDNGVKAVWKPHTQKWHSNYRAEVLAYELDAKFGFDLVPPTVAREVNGVKGSMQLFRESGGKLSAEGKRDLERQSLFDYIIDNKDRKSRNWLVENGRVVSIDNGVSFTGNGINGVSFRKRKKEIVKVLSRPEGKQIVAKIKKSMNPEFLAELEEYLGKSDAKKLWNRMEKIIELEADINGAR